MRILFNVFFFNLMRNIGSMVFVDLNNRVYELFCDSRPMLYSFIINYGINFIKSLHFYENHRFPPIFTEVKIYASICTHFRTSDVTLDETEGILRMYLRGRPVVLNIPTAVSDTYDINEVVKPPSERLKLDWVTMNPCFVFTL